MTVFNAKALQGIILSAILLAALPALAGDFAGLRPGQSTLADAKRTLGAATIKGNVLRFNGDRFDALEILVEAYEATDVIQSITIVPKTPSSMEQVTEWFQLKAPDTRVRSGEEELLTYYPQLLRLALRGSGVVRLIHVAPGLILADSRKTIESLLARGDRAGAIEEMIKIRQFDPGLPDIAFMLAETLLEEGRAGDAMEVVAESLRFSPDNESGELLRRFIEAELKLNSPGWLGIHLGAGRVTRVFRNTPAAEAGLREGDIILSVHGTGTKDRRRFLDALSRLNAGDSIVVKYRRSEAEREVEIRPIDREIYFKDYKPAGDLVAAMVLVERGRTDEADKLLKQTIKAAPTPEAYYESAQAQEALRIEDGLTAWKRFMAAADQRTPEEWKAHAREEIAALEAAIPVYREGLELEKAGKFEEALELFLRVKVDSSNPFFYQGYCLKRVKRYPEAITAFARGLLFCQTESVGWFNMAECYEYLNLATARAVAGRFLKLAAGKEKMKSLIDRATELKTRVEASLARRIFAAKLEAKGLLTQALADYEAASANCPNSTELLLDRARVLDSLNRLKEASFLREEAEALAPKSSLRK